MNEYNLTFDYYGLLHLHQALLEAKFHLEPDNALVSGSPSVADLYIRVRDLLMGSEKGDAWKDWFLLKNRPDRKNQAIILMRKCKRWNKADPDEKKEIARNFLAPFLFGEEELESVIKEVDGGILKGDGQEAAMME